MTIFWDIKAEILVKQSFVLRSPPFLHAYNHFPGKVEPKAIAVYLNALQNGEDVIDMYLEARQTEDEAIP